MFSPDLLGNISVLISATTGLCAILNLILQNFLDYRKQLKIKTVDLFFKSKSEAYIQFIDASSRLLTDPGNLTLQAEAQRAHGQAAMFSSEETRTMLSSYMALCMLPSVDGNNYALAYRNIIEAMQRELYEYKHYRDIKRS